jgi:GntR family transcriptional regulator
MTNSVASDSTAERGVAAYRRLAETLRTQMNAGAYGPEGRLPTEVELQKEYSVSRHTIREALRLLEADGLIYRVQGRGTFASGRGGYRNEKGRYLRSVGSLEEISVWPDTNMEVIEPFTTRVDPTIAARLELTYIEVSRAVVRRWFAGAPFVLTRHYVAPALGKLLRKQGIPSRGEGTVIGAADKYLTAKVAGARQDITAMSAPQEEAEAIGCEPGEAILLIERTYYDTAGSIVEFTASHFNPRRYTYRMELHRRGT